MSGQEKLQRAIEAAIVAGYQLNSEAFEFLTENAETMDPEAVMNMALIQLSALDDKPMFIDRDRLVSVIHQLAVAEMQEAIERQEQANAESAPEPISTPSYTATPQQPQSYPAPTINAVDPADYFYPYAKDIPADLVV